MTRLLALMAAVASILAGFAVAPSASAAPMAPASAKVIHVRYLKAVENLKVSRHSHEAGYDRDKQFGDWITQYGECDTRAVVLMAESLKPVTKNQYCTVSKGRWFSYYNARYYRNAYGGKVQIDHTVPVYNAWITGAWRWTKATRVAYYNDLGDPRSLVAVDAHDNEVKEGDDPTDWTPSHGLCRYLRSWVAVKTRWHLSITRVEHDFLIKEPCPNPMMRVKRAHISYR